MHGRESLSPWSDWFCWGLLTNFPLFPQHNPIQVQDAPSQCQFYLSIYSWWVTNSPHQNYQLLNTHTDLDMPCCFHRFFIKAEVCCTISFSNYWAWSLVQDLVIQWNFISEIYGSNLFKSFETTKTPKDPPPNLRSKSLTLRLNKFPKAPSF